MKHTRRPLFLDKLEITLSIERAEAQIIYDQVNKYWEYREAIVTRIDLTIDYQHMEITDYHYFCVGPHDSDDSYSSTLYLGAKSSSRFWHSIYRKDKEEEYRKGFTDYKHPVLRFERMDRLRVSMTKLHEIANPFNKLHAYQFDADDPDFVTRFIHSRATNQEHRRSFIIKLKNHCLHAAIRQFSSEGDRNIILTALKPYRVDLFPDNAVWSRELTRALGFIDQLKPRGERLKLKPTVPAVDHCDFNVPVTTKLMYGNRIDI